MYLVLKRGWGKDQLEEILNSALAPIAGIILITGAGGMFGKVLDRSGVGKALADSYQYWITCLIARFHSCRIVTRSTGSATVAVITTATILAPAITATGYTGYSSRISYRSDGGWFYDLITC